MPLPPSVNLLNAGSLRRVFVRFQAMSDARRRSYAANVRIAQKARKWAAWLA